jgi:3-oxoacyl-[acyl-carrier protein] reductase
MKRVIIITGASKGIGRYLAEHYLQANHIVIGCSRSESTLVHNDYEHYELDVSDEVIVRSMVSEIARKYKHVDGLINNAGIASMNHSLLTPLETVDKIFKTNVYGTFLFSREVAKIMARSKYGRIVNISTVGVPFRLEGEAVYTASKAAVEMLSKVMAKELALLGVTVNTVGPTPAETDLIKNVPKQKIEDLLKRQAIPEFSRYEDILNVIEFFMSGSSRMITGQTIYLGGVS